MLEAQEHPDSYCESRTRELIEQRVPGFDEGYRARDWAAVLLTGGWFEDVEQIEVGHEVTMSRERYLDLWRSHHLLAASAGQEGVARLLATLEPKLPESFAVPYRCRAWTARAARDLLRGSSSGPRARGGVQPGPLPKRGPQAPRRARERPAPTRARSRVSSP